METITQKFRDICRNMGEYGEVLLDEVEHSDRPIGDWREVVEGIRDMQKPVKPAVFPDWVLKNE